MTKEVILYSTLWTSHLCVASFQQYLHVEHIIYQFIWYSRVAGSYQDASLIGGLLLTKKLLNIGFIVGQMKSSPLRKFWDGHYDLVKRYGISVTYVFRLPFFQFRPVSSFMTYWIFDNIKTIGATCGTGTEHRFKSSKCTKGPKQDSSWFMLYINGIN